MKSATTAIHIFLALAGIGLCMGLSASGHQNNERYKIQWQGTRTRQTGLS